MESKKIRVTVERETSVDERYKYADFCRVTLPIVEMREEKHDLNPGECHIALDYLPKGFVAREPECDGGTFISMCGNICVMDKFHIMDALMDGLEFTMAEKFTYFAAHVSMLNDEK